MANLNPHFHYPLVDELRRQISLGAVGLKLHPVHGSFSPNDRMLYPAYAFSEAEGTPVVFHCGTSVFPGSTNRYADPVLIEDVVRDFPDLTVVLAHGGRGWWYDAAFITLMRPNVWIEVSGLPPQRLPHYYKNHDFEKLARKMIFGTDWPGVPGIEANALSLIDLGLKRDGRADPARQRRAGLPTGHGKGNRKRSQLDSEIAVLLRCDLGFLGLTE